MVEKLENVTLVEEEIAVLDMLDETKRMSAAVRLQRAFEREKEKRERSERLGRELLNPPKKEPIKEDGEGGIMPANHTGVTVSTDQPKIYPKKKPKGVIGLARRPKPIGAI